MDSCMTELEFPENVLELWKRAGGVMQLQSLYSSEGSRAYDLATSTDYSEIREMVTTVSRSSGEILELAAGAGRLTLPLATLGRRITALDLSSEMLTMLRDKTSRLPESLRRNVEPVEADMTAFKLSQEFGTIIIAATSITLLDAPARQELYKRVNEHLSDDGVFVVTVAKGLDNTQPHVVETHVTPTNNDEMTFVVSYKPAEGYRDVFMVHRRVTSVEPLRVFHSRVQLFTLADLSSELEESGFHIISNEPVDSGNNNYQSVVVSARRIQH